MTQNLVKELSYGEHEVALIVVLGHSIGTVGGHDYGLGEKMEGGVRMRAGVEMCSKRSNVYGKRMMLGGIGGGEEGISLGRKYLLQAKIDRRWRDLPIRHFRPLSN